MGAIGATRPLLHSYGNEFFMLPRDGTLFSFSNMRSVSVLAPCLEVSSHARGNLSFNRQSDGALRTARSWVNSLPALEGVCMRQPVK